MRISDWSTGLCSSYLRNEVETAGTHEMELNDRLRTARDEMVRMDKAEVSVGQLSLQLGANRNLYESLLKRYTETVALRDNQQPDARVISRAQIPLSPAYPKATQTLALAVVGSVCLGFAQIGRASCRERVCQYV